VTRVLDQGDVMSFGVRGDFDDDHLTPSLRETSKVTPVSDQG
jgi:hypothetical protein